MRQRRKWGAPCSERYEGSALQTATIKKQPEAPKVIEGLDQSRTAALRGRALAEIVEGAEDPRLGGLDGVAARDRRNLPRDFGAAAAHLPHGIGELCPPRSEERALPVGLELSTREVGETRPARPPGFLRRKGCRNIGRSGPWVRRPATGRSLA